MHRETQCSYKDIVNEIFVCGGESLQEPKSISVEYSLIPSLIEFAQEQSDLVKFDTENHFLSFSNHESSDRHDSDFRQLLCHRKLL